MMRLLTVMPLAIGTFAAALAMSAFATGNGFVSEDTVRLWASAIAAGDGEIPIGRVVAAYPTLPFLATTVLELVTPGVAPTPALLAALVLGLLGGGLFLALRNAGAGIAGAVIATMLIALHPAMLRAAISGPAEMLLAAFLAMLAKGLYDLRAHTSAPDVMTVALALLGLSFSHPMGAAIALATIPFLALSVRPSVAAASGVNVVIALVFPTVFCVGAFVYVSWVFPGSGWTFLTVPSASLSAWAAELPRSLGRQVTGILAIDAGLLALLAMLLGAPVAAVGLLRIRHRRALLLPALVLAAGTIGAAAATVISGAFGSPAAVAVAAPVIAAIVMVRIPPITGRMPQAIALLMLGWIGGAAGVALLDPRLAAQVREATLDQRSDSDGIDALNLGHATAGRDGILVDTVNAPAVVVGRGQSRGLLAPHGQGFELALLLGRLHAPYVAVPDPHSVAGLRDQLNKAFPKLYRSGAPGYRLVYQNATWRMFERTEGVTVAGDHRPKSTAN